MSEHKELMKVLLDADEAYKPEGAMWPQLATAILAAGYAKPRTVPTIGALTEALGEKHLDGAHGIHIVGKGWIELPGYVREELAVEILKLFTPTDAGSET